MIRYIDDLQLTGKRVFIRVDFNVPLDEQSASPTTPASARRCRPSAARWRWAARSSWPPTSGAPRAPDPKLSLEPAGRAARRAARRKHEVILADDCIGDGVKKLVKDCKDGQVLLLENLRFHKEEEANDEAFARELAALATSTSNDAFGTAHRAHASTAGMVPFVKEKAAGLLDAQGARVPAAAAQEPGEALRGDPRRRQGRATRSRSSRPAAQGGRAADRRRDGLHLPQGAGRRGGQEPRSRRTSSRWRTRSSRRRSG